MIVFGYRNKFVGLSRALIAIIAGLALIIWPGLATTIFVQLVAAFLIIRAFVAMIWGGSKNFISYFIEVLLAIVLFMGADVISGFVLYIIAFLMILFGAYQLIILVRAYSALRGGRFTAFLPALIIVCSLCLFFMGGNDWVSYLAGTVLILYGISDIISLWTVEHYSSKIFKGFEHFRRHEKDYEQAQTREQESVDDQFEQDHSSPMDGIDYENVKDVDYEKVDE